MRDADGREGVSNQGQACKALKTRKPKILWPEIRGIGEPFGSRREPAGFVPAQFTSAALPLSAAGKPAHAEGNLRRILRRVM